MELYGIEIVNVEDVPVLVLKGRNVNLFSKEFAIRYLSQVIPISEELQAALVEIKAHFKSRSKEHDLRKYIIPIDITEIRDFKESKLNVCTNEHLKKTHRINNKFLQRTLSTSSAVVAVILQFQ